MDNKDAIVTFIFVLFCVVVVFYVPLVGIWSINNLFNLDIPYNWKTWASFYILYVYAGALTAKNKDVEPKINKFWR